MDPLVEHLILGQQLRSRSALASLLTVPLHCRQTILHTDTGVASRRSGAARPHRQPGGSPRRNRRMCDLALPPGRGVVALEGDIPCARMSSSLLLIFLVVARWCQAGLHGRTSVVGTLTERHVFGRGGGVLVQPRQPADGLARSPAGKGRTPCGDPCGLRPPPARNRRCAMACGHP